MLRLKIEMICHLMKWSVVLRPKNGSVSNVTSYLMNRPLWNNTMRKCTHLRNQFKVHPAGGAAKPATSTTQTPKNWVVTTPVPIKMPKSFPAQNVPKHLQCGTTWRNTCWFILAIRSTNVMFVIRVLYAKTIWTATWKYTWVMAPNSLVLYAVKCSGWNRCTSSIWICMVWNKPIRMVFENVAFDFVGWVFLFFFLGSLYINIIFNINNINNYAHSNRW